MSTRKLVVSMVSAQIVRFGLTVISGPILSRLVGPVPYGILAPAQSVAALGRLVAESGFAYHTVTSPTLSREQAKDLHWQSMRLALCISIVAGIVAACMGHVPVWQRGFRAALAISGVILLGSAAVPTAWGQRVGKMSKLEWVSVASQAGTTFAVAIPLAFLGAKIAAATSNLYLPSLFLTVFAWRVSSFAKHHKETARIDASYRAGTLGVNISTYLAGSIDILMTSTYLAVGPLGIYSRASLLSSLPGNGVGAAISRVGLVSLSKSDKWEDHKRYLIKGTAITFGGFLILATLSFTGLDIMRIAFGPKFASSSFGFGVLTLSQTFYFAGSLLDTYLTVKRKLTIIAASHSVQALISTALFLGYKPTTLLAIGLILLCSAVPRYIFLLCIIIPENFKQPQEEPSKEEQLTA